MPRTIPAMLAATVVLATGACEQPPAPNPPPAAPAAAPTTTDATDTFDPLETIEARRLLMLEAGRQIEPIDLYTIGTPADPADLRAAAVTIESLLPAFPHLFPSSTNLFDPTTREPPTTALPAVWENFAAFQAMNVATEEAAAALAAADGEESIKAAAQNLRAACDACHQAFTKRYVPPQVTDEDRDFDFEEFLPK
ncbi:MAG TPA: cytochrome c [Gammaproteobacteria bacterium]